MHTTSAPGSPARQPARLRLHGRILLVAAGLAAALLAAGCDTAQQVPWATYSSQLQPRIDAAVATRDCVTLRVLLTGAKATSTVHEKATGFPNDALVSYIQAAQQTAGCPVNTG